LYYDKKVAAVCGTGLSFCACRQARRIEKREDFMNIPVIVAISVFAVMVVMAVIVAVVSAVSVVAGVEMRSDDGVNE